ncbi:MAG: tRNA pseudouridine(38-40) synthase TruA [Ruminococcaceae bacterium]|nr:tRNA pseudouridine(38-40) synthase TruA [Oscillospiraceae bacterium]
MRNLRFSMSYDGTDYHGFQIQKDEITIEGVLKNAVNVLTGEDVDIIGCGRTDAGVHAQNYIFNFKTNSSIPCDKFPIALNTVTPDDITILSCEEVEENFHSRFCAKQKTYRYIIYNSRFKNPFLNRFSYHYKHKLDIESMNVAKKYIEGTHDFQCFMAQGSVVRDTVRTVYSIDITAKDDMIFIDVCGNGFLYNMVRIIVGTLIGVGNGKIQSEDISKIIEGRKRENAGMTVPACGLYLKEVVYEN